MHVGAAVPPDAARGAEAAWLPDASGFWGDSPDRKQLAAAYCRELRAYTPGATGRVRFPAEMPWTLAAAGCSRYLRYIPERCKRAAAAVRGGGARAQAVHRRRAPRLQLLQPPGGQPARVPRLSCGALL